MISRFLTAALLVATTFPALAQTLKPASAKSPADFLGYTLGDRFTRHHNVVDYMEHLAATTPSAHWTPYGKTNELRTLGTLTLSSPENLVRLEALRQANLARVRTGKPALASTAQTERTLDLPIIWLSYNVHGNEAVCTEAAMATAYELLQKHSDWLAHAVVIIDPCVNPDGRDRYVAFQDRTTGPMAMVDLDPQALEHDEPWPGGRSNHYLFDMNRDWAWQTQIETQQRVAAYRRWMPHVHVDFHEMGVNSPYYFAPAAEPLHHAITPWQRRCQEHIGQNNARWFDARGALYFTREVFDLFYPSYGDTWPMFHGAIGMTYEQGGSSRAGRAIRTKLGETLTLAYRIENHLEAGLSTVEESIEQTGQLVENFTAYHARNLSGESGKFGSYLIPGDPRINAPERLNWLTSVLDLNGISYGQAPSANSLSGYDYNAGSTRSRLSCTSRDLIIDGHQADAAFLHVLFDPDPILNDSLTYDITAWALPHALGLKAYALETHLKPTASWPIASPNRPMVEGGNFRPYAWIGHSNTDAGTKALAMLLRAGVVVRVSDAPLRIQSRSYPAGTWVVTRRNNEDVPDLNRLVARTSAATGVQFNAVSTGLAESGHDLGSDHYAAIQPPRVATLQGERSSSLSSGEIWHRFDTQLGYPLTRVATLDDLDIVDFDVLILPSGWYGFDEEQLERLSDWVRSGGQLVAIASACGSFAGKDGWGLKRHEGTSNAGGRTQINDERDAHQSGASGLDIVAFNKKSRERLRTDLPGAIYTAAVDPSHPLAYGYGAEYKSLKTSGSAYAPLASGNAMSLLNDGEPFSGHSGSQVAERIGGSLVAGVHNMGRGHVVYLADNPLFRAFWRNGHRLFDNAVFLGPSM